MPRYIKTCEPIDDFLASQGLTRKITAKDGSCLFRAVAEQVFHTQALHNKVRQACIRFMERNKEHFEPFVEGPFDHHLFKLQNAKEWAGQVEISALSLMCKRDFIIYQDPGKPPNNVTQNGYPDKVLLCFSNNNHYDSVFTKRYQSSLAVCQSIIYEILYKKVFNIAKEADEAVEILRNSPGKKPARLHGPHDGFHDGMDSISQRSPQRHEDDERDRFGRPRLEKRRPPLPYKVAKALDPEIYRNVEYDCWNEGNKEQMHQDFLMATGLQFCPGDKVQVQLDDSKKWYSAHIQEVKPDKGPITVFVEDLGEKHEIPVKNVKPHPANPPRAWSVAGGRGYKNLSGYHQKYSNGITNGAGDYRSNRGKPPGKWGGRNQGMVMLAQSFSPGPEGMGETQGLPYSMRPQQNGNHKGTKMPSPFRVMEGQPDHLGRGRSHAYHGGQLMQSRGARNGRLYAQGMAGSYPYEGDVSSEETDESRKMMEENMALYELDQSSFPSLAANCGPPSGPINHQAQFWSKLRKDGRRSASPQQRMDTPSPHFSDKRPSDPSIDNMLPGQFQDMILTAQDQRGVDPSCMERHYSPISAMTDESMMHPSSPSMPKSATPSSLSMSPSLDPQTGSPPNIAPAGYIPPVAMGVPFYNYFIPMNDWNLTGQVNWGAPISRDPNGSDLPMSDMNTLRFFYNLGAEYHRRLCMLQQYQQQQCYQLQATGPLPQHQQQQQTHFPHHPQQHQPQHSHHQQQQQQPFPHNAGYASMMPHPGMAIGGAPPLPSMGKVPYGGMAVVGSGGGGGSGGGDGAQEEDDQQEVPISYDGPGQGRASFSQGYISEPIPINASGLPQHPSSAVYSLASPCTVGGGGGGDTYIPFASYPSQLMQQQGHVPGNPMGIPASPQGPYMYSQPMPATPMSYTPPGGKMAPHHAPHSAYSPTNPVAYVQMTPSALPQQPQPPQHTPQHQQPGCMLSSNSQGGGSVAATGGGQYGVQSASVVSNSSCSSQDSGILSSSPTQVPYTTSG